MRNYPSEKQLPMKDVSPEHIKAVAETILTRIGKSRYEIAEILREWDESGDDQLTLYDAQDIETFEQMKFD